MSTTPAELKELVAAGESETLELKESLQVEGLESVSAFSNAHGGRLVLGVNNRRQVVGMAIGPETTAQIVNRVAMATEPTVIPEVEVMELDGKKICLLSVGEYPLKPVAVRGRCYRRVGTSNRQMTPQEISQMHLACTNTSWDAFPAPGRDLDELDLDRVKDYMEAATRIGRRRFKTDEKPVNALRKLELVVDNTPTWASLLLFGKNPQGPLTQATIHCGRFRTGIDIIDDRLIGGSILDQVNETMDFLQKHMSVRFEFTGKPQRNEIWDYPLPALREAITNAICHRSYQDN